MKLDFTKPSERFRPDKADIGVWNSQLDEITQEDGLDSVMRSLASIVDEYDTSKMDRLQCAVYHKALDWLQTLKTQVERLGSELGAVKAIAYQTGCGNSDGELVKGTEHDMVMFYNTAVISDEDAAKILDQGRQDMDPRVVVLWPQQAVALFPKLHENDPEKGEADGKTDET